MYFFFSPEILDRVDGERPQSQWLNFILYRHSFPPPSFSQDITPEYDNGLGYWTPSIPEGAPVVAAHPGNNHAIPYPATYGHKYQTEHQLY